MYLTLLEKFHGSARSALVADYSSRRSKTGALGVGCGNGASYTSSGNSVGECKLFVALHTLKLIKDDSLAAFPGVAGFYAAMAAHEKTKPMLADGSKYPHALAQYFIAGA